MNDKSRQSEDEKTEDTGFGAGGPSGQPDGSWTEDSRGEMAAKNKAAVGHGEQERFAKIETGMPADGHPKTSRAAQDEGKQKARSDNANDAEPVFATLQVRGAKDQRQNDGGRPKADSVRERELRIASEEELLRKTDK